MIVITRCKDENFIVSNGIDLDVNLTQVEVLCLCTWKYGIRTDNLKSALVFTKARGHDITVFHNDIEYNTKKVDYSKVL